MRLFSVYGPRMRSDLAMRKLADSLRTSKPAFCIRGDAAQMSRDYTYADDAASAFSLAVKHLADLGIEDSFFKTVDICNGKP